MGVERRGNRLYLYRRERINGRLRGVYLCRLCPLTEGFYRAIEELKRLERQRREFEVECLGYWADHVLEAGEEFDRLADRVFRAVMYLTGHGLHKRSEWRRTHGVTPMASVNELFPRTGKPKPAMIVPVGNNAEVQKLFDRAAAGDLSVLPAIKTLFADPKLHYRESIGAVESWARMALVRAVAGDDVAVAEAVGDKLNEYRKKLLEESGPNPPFAERMAAMRAAHNWFTVSILEMELAAQDAGSRSADAISRQLSRAERRLQASLKARRRPSHSGFPSIIGDLAFLLAGAIVTCGLAGYLLSRAQD